MEKTILENPGPCKELWKTMKKSGSDHIREILNPYEENLIMERNGDRRRSFSIMQSIGIDILHFYFYVHIYIYTYSGVAIPYLFGEMWIVYVGHRTGSTKPHPETCSLPRTWRCGHCAGRKADTSIYTYI